MANPWWRLQSIKPVLGLSSPTIFNLPEQSRLASLGIEFEVAGFKILAPGQVISQLTVIG
jgi:hypothetical protein